MKEVNDISVKSIFINKLKKSEEELFKYINSYPDTVDLVFDKYSISDKFDPVNCLRFLLANEIKKGNTISSDLIKQIIDSLEKKDISNYYNVSDEFQKSLNNKNLSNRSWYASWKEFSILFPFIVSDNELEEVNKKCAVILARIIKDLKLENVKTHIVDFLGTQNFGTDSAWCAIIPNDSPDVSSAHQIFFIISPTGLEGGLYQGDKITDKEHPSPHQKHKLYTTIEKYIKDISQELHIWKDLNDSIDFELTKNKRSFVSSLKSNSDESNRLFFNIIDNVIADLNIEDKQNIVFSTTAKRLVFHVGKRYCFRLKNNKFGFITESDYKINNLENKPFSADAGLAANFYSNAEKNDVTLHYSAISSAINAELLRDNSTQEKEYDNKVFRKVVFDKEFRMEFLNTEENQNNECNYWIFQGNPKVYDFEKALQNNVLTDFTISRYKEKIKIGDKVILWLSGKNRGCFGLAEITSEPQKQYDNAGSEFWSDKVNKNKKGLKAGIKVTHNLYENRISKEVLESYDTFNECQIFKYAQGSNFESKETEYNTILNMIENKNRKRYWMYSPGEDACEWEEFKSKSIIGLGWDGLGDLSQYKTKDLLHKSMQKSTGKSNPINDTLANWEFSKLLKKGDIVFVKKGRNELLGYGEVISEYRFDDNKDSYKHIVEVDWKRTGSWSSGHNMVLKTFTDITEYPPTPLSLKFENYVQQLFYIINDEKIMKKPFNKILFGPPGTGKTYELSHEYFDKYTLRNFSSEFENEVNNRKENFRFQMLGTEIGTILHFKDHPEITCEVISDKEIKYDNEVTSLSNSAVQIRSELGYTSKSVAGPKYWCINGISLSKMRKELESYEVQESSQHLMKRNYAFVTFHQAFSYEDFIEGIKPVMNGDTDELKYEIEDGVFKQICNRAKNDPENRYALFIDEINRGNVANIFGELITLIEPDKRAGMDNELSVILPYSKKSFSVPNNLDIIGTMNTADRSVEALDSALRRRFEFEEMSPKPELLKDIKCEGNIDLEQLLLIINKRIEKLLDKDNLIGHSYFMNTEGKLTLAQLKSIFKNKVIPLLQEYFYGDFAKIGLILGGEFVIKDSAEKVFSDFTYEDIDIVEERVIYSFANVDDLKVDHFKSIY